MATDNSDSPSEATVIRPRPGGARLSPGDTLRGQKAAAAVPIAVAPPPRRSPPRAARRPAASTESVRNPLLMAANPLLLLAGQLRSTLNGPDLTALKTQAFEEIRRFEERARAAQIEPEAMNVAHYALCATLDEAVLSTPWGAHGEWGQETLLVHFYGEVVGGQRFFDMLKRVQEDPEHFIDLLEVMAVCLALGFGGEYRVASRGGDRLSELQRDLVGLIRRERGALPQELSPHWRGVQNRKNPVIRYVPWWVVGVAGLAILSLTYLVLFSRLGPPATAVSEAINRAAETAPPDTRPAPPGRRLKDLLDERPDLRGIVSVEETGARTTVTLPDLFASGKDTPQPRFDPLLQTLKQVLSQVSGRITVIGHTDDQPTRKFLYTTNDALSLARATHVVDVVSSADNRHQFVPVGRGKDAPLCTAPTPECRAQNRRVEIRHDP